MWTQNGFANRESNIMEQALNLFWYGAWFAIPMSIGCDWNSKIGGERKLQKDETTFSSPTISDSAEKTSGQSDQSIRTVNLEIVVSGFSTNKGSCRIAVYLGQSHFNDPEYAIAKESVGILDLKASLQIQVAIPDRRFECRAGRTGAVGRMTEHADLAGPGRGRLRIAR